MDLILWEDRALTGTACLLYAAALLAALGVIFWGRQNWRPFQLTFVISGLVFQGLGLYVRGLEIGGLPATNGFEVLQVLSFFAIAINLALRAQTSVPTLNLFAAGFAFLLTLLALSVPAWDSPPNGNVATSSPWVGFHAALAVLSYGVFGILALTSAMYLLQHRALSRRKAGRLARALPAIRVLEELNGRLVLLGVTILTLAVAVGFLNWLHNPEGIGLLKLIVAMMVWAAYLYVLVQRRRQRLVAQPFASTCVGLFVIALLSLWPLMMPAQARLDSPAGITEFFH